MPTPADPGKTRRVRSAVAAGDDTGFDHRRIAALLPHRYPFQFVDRVIDFADGARIVGIKNLSLSDPFLRGHFPDNPVMPGVLICEALAQAGALLLYCSSSGVPPGQFLALTGLDRMRFRRPVYPGDRLRLEVTLVRRRAPLWRLRGQAWVEKELAADGEISLMEIAPSEVQ